MTRVCVHVLFDSLQERLRMRLPLKVLALYYFFFFHPRRAIFSYSIYMMQLKKATSLDGERGAILYFHILIDDYM